MENLNEPFGIAYATKIIDWKIRNNVPRGEAGCKPIVIKKSILALMDMMTLQHIRTKNENNAI